MDPKEIMERLQDPFPPEEIEWRVGSTSNDKTKGIALAYVTNRAIQNRLDAVFGPFGWKNEFREWKGTSQLCGISVKVDGEWITKWDGADDSNTEAVKGGLSDAMKRAAYQWGIGRYLYNLENVWVPIRQQGKSYVLVSEPRLPAWALPKGYEYIGTPRMTQPEPSTEPQREEPRNTGQSARVTPTRESRTPNGLNAKSRVINLKTEMQWDWNALGEFASDVLNRPIKKVITDIKTEDEWSQVEQAMLITKQAS